MFFLRVILRGFAAAGVGLGAVLGEDWPQFRGLSGRGVSSQPAPVTWNAETGEGVAWSQPIPGLGHASPILWKDRVYVATAVRLGGKSELKTGVYGDGESFHEKERHQWRLLCLDRLTGRILWDRLEHEAVPREERHTKATHCNSTPATDGRRLVAVFGSEGLFGFDMEGALVWRRDLGKMDARPWDSPDLPWSFAGSPLLHEGRVLIQCDVHSGSFVAAFDATDGRELWRTLRQEVSNWCTPAIARVGGETQLVLNGWKQLGGYDFKTGRCLWTLSGGGDIPVPAPLVVEDMAYFTSAHGKYRPLRAVRLGLATGDITPPGLDSTNAAIAWSHPRLGSYMQTPIVLGQTLWSCDWLGVLSALDRLTGEIRYSERLGGGGDAFTASGVSAGDRLYFASESGQVYVVRAGPRFEVMATNRLGAPCLATPAVGDGVLYFRTTEKLLAVGGGKKS